MDIADFIVEGAARRVISPLEGDIAAKRPEGAVSHQSPAPSFVAQGVGASRPATPSVAFGDISPSRGEITRSIASALKNLRRPCRIGATLLVLGA